MIKKALILLIGLSVCLTNGFANEAPEPIFEVRIPESEAYIQGNEDIKRGPNSIFGTPDFEKMRDLPENSRDYQLGRKVAFLLIPAADGPGGTPRNFICTGFLVGPDLLMTNHHCVHDAFGGQASLESIQVYMDYYQERNVDPTRGGVTAGVTAVLSADALMDYALLRLDKPIGNTYGWLELDTTTRVNSSQHVKIISHNAGRSKEIVRRNSQIVDIPPGHLLADFPFMFVYLADTEGGSSGGPIFLRDGTGVIGINHSGWYDRDGPIFNAGSLMSYIVPEIEQWLPGGAAPDLAVESPRISKEFLQPGESFTLSATVRNQGTVAAPATTLRFYRSSDTTITPSDVVVGSASVRALAPNATTELDITLTAPTSEGTYYYGGCVDAVGNDGRTDNNCSAAVWVKVSTTPPFWVYWTGLHNIQRTVSDGTNRQFLVTGLFESTGIALDVEGGKMYWTDSGAGKIQRADLDGTNVENLITGLPVPHGIALDVEGGKIYWTNLINEIQRADLDGFNVEDLVSLVGRPHDIALDVANGKMYWVNRDVHKIQRADLDGSNVEDLVRGLSAPSGIALDVANGKMYWTNFAADKIQRADLDGSNVEDLVVGVDLAVGIALDVANGKMYWTNFAADKIQRADLDGSNVEDFITYKSPTSHYYLALGISPSTAPPPIAPISLNPDTIADQRYLVNTRITPLTLPVATGGTPPYTYTLSPVPAGLAFTAATRSLSGTPTTAGTTDVTYTATDTRGTSADLTFSITVIEDDPGPDPNPDPLDVNGDGQVTAMDLVAVALFYGTQVPAGLSLSADVNADGVVNVLDLTAVARGIDAAGGTAGIHGLSLEEVEAAVSAVAEQAAALEVIAEAPMRKGHAQVSPKDIAYRNVANALAAAGHLGYSVPTVLEELLALLTEMAEIPESTALLPNYPNPFNPETWLPYQLSTPAAVTLSIYSVDGQLVRTLDVGYQPAGVYQSRSRAVYWDGKNEFGEPVASGVYFYTLTAGDFTATRKMLIAK